MSKTMKLGNKDHTFCRSFTHTYTFFDQEKEVELKELVTLSSVIEGLKEVIITKLKDKFTKPKN